MRADDAIGAGARAPLSELRCCSPAGARDGATSAAAPAEPAAADHDEQRSASTITNAASQRDPSLVRSSGSPVRGSSDVRAGRIRDAARSTSDLLELTTLLEWHRCRSRPTPERDSAGEQANARAAARAAAARQAAAEASRPPRRRSVRARAAGPRTCSARELPLEPPGAPSGGSARRRGHLLAAGAASDLALGDRRLVRQPADRADRGLDAAADRRSTRTRCIRCCASSRAGA